VVGLGITAAMVPTRTLQLATDPQLILLEVDVVPHQPQRLALPQPQGQRDRPPRTVGKLGRRQQYPSALLQRIRFELDLTDARDDRVDARVGDQQPALDGGVQHRAQDPVQRDSTLREPLGHPVEQVVDVAYREPGQRLGPQWDAVGTDQAGVVVERLGLASALDDHQPLVEPLAQSQLLIRTRAMPGAGTFALQRRHLRRDLRARASSHMPPDRLARIGAPHRDIPLPTTILSSINRGAAIGHPATGLTPAHDAATEAFASVRVGRP
jgi:hypothetical protein